MQALKPQQEKFWSKALPVTAGLATVHTLYAIPPFQSDRLEKKQRFQVVFFYRVRMDYELLQLSFLHSVRLEKKELNNAKLQYSQGVEAIPVYTGNKAVLINDRSITTSKQHEGSRRAEPLIP